jgi:hypothetical protein
LSAGFDFDRQEKNIISWHQADIKEEIAISFLEAYVCLESWKIICIEMGKEFDDVTPLPAKCNLDKIIEQLEGSDLEMKGIILNIYSKRPSHLTAFFRLFENAESRGDRKTINKLLQIARGLAFSGEMDMLLLLLNDAHIENFIG